MWGNLSIWRGDSEGEGGQDEETVRHLEDLLPSNINAHKHTFFIYTKRTQLSSLW